MRNRETIGGINPSHDVTHDIKKFPGMEHARPEDDAYENKRKREPGKTFRTLEEMPDTSGSSDPLFLVAMEELRDKIKRQEMTLEEIDVDDTAHEFGVSREEVEDALSLEEIGTGVRELQDEDDAQSPAGGVADLEKAVASAKEVRRSGASSSMVRGGTAIRRGTKGGESLHGLPHAQDRRYNRRRMPENKPRYKAPGDRARKTIRTEKPPEQQAE